jgi:hypothetical protein
VKETGERQTDRGGDSGGDRDRERGRERDRERDSERDRERDRERGSERDRETETDRWGGREEQRKESISFSRNLNSRIKILYSGAELLPCFFNVDIQSHFPPFSLFQSLSSV